MQNREPPSAQTPMASPPVNDAEACAAVNASVDRLVARQQDSQEPMALPPIEDDEETYYESLVDISSRWIVDEANTLKEVIQNAEAYIEEMSRLQAEGYELQEGHENGRGDVRRPSGDHSPRVLKEQLHWRLS
jgi:cell pole-organizing protein PopZ